MSRLWRSAFKVDGKTIAGFGSYKNHLSYLPTFRRAWLDEEPARLSERERGIFAPLTPVHPT